MTEKSKSWVKDNVMGIIIAVMFTAFWVQWENERRDNKKDNKELRQSEETNRNQIRNLAMIMLADPDTDEESKIILREYIKIETRGVTIKQ